MTVVSGHFSSASPRLATAALSLLTRDTELDNCGQMMEAYLSSLLAGQPHEVAREAAAEVYEENYSAGGLEASPLTIPCSAAEVAWKAAVAGGDDPLLPAALAFLQSSPPSHSPCEAAAREYFQVREHIEYGCSNVVM